MTGKVVSHSCRTATVQVRKMNIISQTLIYRRQIRLQLTIKSKRRVILLQMTKTQPLTKARLLQKKSILVSSSILQLFNLKTLKRKISLALYNSHKACKVPLKNRKQDLYTAKNKLNDQMRLKVSKSIIRTTPELSKSLQPLVRSQDQSQSQNKKKI